MVEGVQVGRRGTPQFAVSQDGTLAFVPGTAADASRRELVTVGGDGESRLSTPVREDVSVAWSPGETRVAVQIGVGEAADVWVAETDRGTLTRITSEPGFDGQPLWSLDGRHILFASLREGRWQLRRMASDGTGPAEVLATFDEGAVRPYSWTPGGDTLLFDLRRSRTDSDIGVLPLNGRGAWRLILDSEADEDGPVVSPDGRWIAYTSTDSGQDEVYLQRFPELGDRRAVSVGEAYMARWARDGRAIYYMRGPNNAVMRAPFSVDPAAGTPVIGTPQVLQPYRYFSMPFPHRLYDVSADGQRMLVVDFSRTEASPQRQINVVLNWFGELKRLVPVR